ncbi:MAG: adaptor protein MecA [Butyrivibrio sp.]|jgi:adapter protein MecA 1/2|nr:adaptor protein MecA [Butyrivibrio sp.]
MKFTRINKDTVNCIITEDDLDEQGIKLEDLFERKKEAMDFLHEVVERASEEVDYKPSGSYTPMQITILPDHSISLTLSENATGAFEEIMKNLTEKLGLRFPQAFLEELGDVPEEERIQKLQEYLANLKQFAGYIKDMKPGDGQSIPVNAADGTKAVSSAKRPGKQSQDMRKKALERLQMEGYVFSFDSIREVVTFCSHVSGTIRFQSVLYKDQEQNRFYLHFLRGRDSMIHFASVFTMAYEFGKFTTTGPVAISHMQETMECVIAERAVNRLRRTAESRPKAVKASLT